MNPSAKPWASHLYVLPLVSINNQSNTHSNTCADQESSLTASPDELYWSDVPRLTTTDLEAIDTAIARMSTGPAIPSVVTLAELAAVPSITGTPSESVIIPAVPSAITPTAPSVIASAASTRTNVGLPRGMHVDTSHRARHGAGRGTDLYVPANGERHPMSYISPI